MGNSRICFSALCVYLMVSAQTALGQDRSQCSDVLEEHLLTKSETNLFSDTQYIYARDYATMSYREFRENLDAGATIPIEGIPVEGNISSEQFQKWQNEVREQIDLSDIQTHRTSILLSSANDKAIEAWEKCIVSRGAGGIYLYLQPQSSALFTIKFFARPSAFEQAPPIIEGAPLVKGAKIINGEEFFKQGRTLGTDRIITVERSSEQDDVLIALNTSAGPAKAFAIGKKPLPAIDQTIVQEHRLHYNDNFALNQYHEIATPPEEAFPITHIAGTVTTGPVIAGGRDGDRLWYMDSYSSGQWHALIPAPFTVRGLAGNNTSGPLIFGGEKGRTVAYLRNYSAQGWTMVAAPAPVDIRQIVGNNSHGPIILGTDRRSILRLNSYSNPQWVQIAEPPFRVTEIAGNNQAGIVAYGGPDNRSVAYMSSWAANTWERLPRAPEPISIIMGSGRTGPMILNDRGDTFYLIRNYQNATWERRIIPYKNTDLAFGDNSGIMVAVAK